MNNQCSEELLPSQAVSKDFPKGSFLKTVTSIFVAHLAVFSKEGENTLLQFSVATVTLNISKDKTAK